MDNEEISFILCSIETLTKENCELRARLKAVEQNTKTLPTCSAAAAECNMLSDEQNSDELVLLCNNDVKPLSKKRLDEIIQSIGTSKSTWSDLRQLYPPRQSDFAPLTDFDDLDVDEAYSQAATMAAYGVELLRIALSCPQIDRRLTRQTSCLLATLCSTLIDTRDQHRHTRHTDMSLKSEGMDTHKCGKQQDDSKPCQREERIDSPFSNKHRRTYCCDHSSLGSSLSSISSDPDSIYSGSQCRQHYRRAKRIKKGTLQDNDSTTDVKVTAPIVLVPVPSGSGNNVPEEDASNDGDISASDADVEDEPDQVLGQGRVMKLHRRVVIRNALMHHGLSESDSIAYYNRWTKDTNTTYNCVWNRWVVWCSKLSLDPTERSEERLTTCISESTTSKSSATSIRIVARSVWSIIDGTALLKDTGQ